MAQKKFQEVLASKLKRVDAVNEYQQSFSIFVKFILQFCSYSTSDFFRRSFKKGLVIPSWPRHICHDFEAFSTPTWWYNYHTYANVTDDK